MKKYFLFSSAFLFSFLFGLGVAQAAIVRVQTNAGSNDGSTNTVSATWGSSTTQGDLLVAIVGFNSGAGAVVTPPVGEGWTSAIGVRSTNGTDDITTEIFYIPNAGSQSGSSTWTITSQPVGGFATVTLVEYSGVDPSNPLHTTGSATGNGALGDSGTTTPNYDAGEVAVAGITTASGNTNFSAETNSYSEESEIASILTPMAPGINTAFEDRMPTLAAGNQGVQVTIFGTYTTPTWAWAGVIATFNPEPDTAIGGTDMCVNIAGDQLTVPAGYAVDAASGDCVEEGTGTGTGGTQQTSETGKGIAPFTDTETHWASTYIQELYSMGVVSGRTPTSFAPDENLTRAEMVKIADLIFGFPVTDGETPSFKDVHPTDWFAKYIAVAEKNGIVGGYTDGTFMPNSNIKRGEALKILLAAAARSNNMEFSIYDRWGNMVFFTDVDQSAWYAKYVNFAFANEIVNGKTLSTFAPDDNVTRAEISKMGVLTTRKFGLGSVGAIELLPRFCKIAIGGASNCGKLVVIKNTNPLSTQVFGFNGGVGAFNLDNDGGIVSPYSTIPNSRTFTVPPGNYTVNEVSVSGYYISALSCVSNNQNGLKTVTYLHDPVTTSFTGFTVGVPAGETVTCTFTNTRGIDPGSSGTTGNGTTIGNSVGDQPGTEATVVGNGGIILYSNDTGLIWTQKSSGVTDDLMGVSFADKHNGLAVGRHGVMTKSTNDGVTWTAQTSGTGTDLYAVSYGTSTTATAVGALGKVIRTTDGGVTWTAQTSNTTNNLFGVSFSGANNGVAVGDSGVVIRTTNGGTTWTASTASATTWKLLGVYMSTPLIGTTVGAGCSGSCGTILRTTDGGVTWTTQTIPAAVSDASHTPIAVWFDGSGMNGTVVGANGLILTTTNGGTAWMLETGAPTTSTYGPQNFHGVSYYKTPYNNSNMGVIASDHTTTARTVNGGLLWTDITNLFTGTDTRFNGVNLH